MFAARADERPASSERLTALHYKVLSLSALGGVLEFFEFIIFILLAPQIGKLFFPPEISPWVKELQTLAIFAVGYLARPIGGVVLAALGDVFGRNRIFAATLALMALPTLLIGLLPTYAVIGFGAPLALLLCRIVQGLSLGGELPTAIVFVSEYVPERRIGRACAIIATSLLVGLMMGSGLVTWLGETLTAADMASYGWRIPFLVGGVFGGIAALLRRYLHETPVYQRMRAQKRLSAAVPFRTLFRDCRTETILCLVLGTVPGAIFASLQLYPITYLELDAGFPAGLVHHAYLWMIASAMVGTMFFGALVDWIGWNKAIPLAAAPTIVATYLFYAEIRPETLVFWLAVIGFFSSFFPTLYNPLLWSFPARARLTGISLCYNFGYAVFAGTTPLILAAGAHYDRMIIAHFPALFCLIAIVVTPIVWRYRKPIGAA